MSTFTSAFLALILQEPLLQASLLLGRELLTPVESIITPLLIGGLYSEPLLPQEGWARAKETHS